MATETTPALEYSYEHLEAAACMWEHVLHALRKHRETRNPWEEYREAEPKAKEAIDNAFICLCGYSLATLIKEGE